MKKALFIFAAGVLLSSCSLFGDKVCKIEGSIDDAELLAKNPYVVVVDRFSAKKDTVAIVDGKFTCQVPACDTVTNTITLADDNGTRYRVHASFIPEAENLTVSLGKEGIVQGGKLNQALNEFNARNDALYDMYRTKRTELMSKYGEDQKGFEEEISAFVDSINAEIKALSLATFKANKNNALGLTGLTNAIYDLSSAEIEELVADVPGFILNNRTVANVRKSKKAEEATAEGTMFVDFSGVTPEGEATKLSDYVGKGKYTLVDFWASWCGPCKGEIPNIKAVFEKYGKEVNVLGIAVWDHDNSGSRETMKQLDMQWSQIFVGEDRTPTDVYGISGIPQIILFAPDGTIAKRNLRGAKIMETIEEVLGK